MPKVRVLPFVGATALLRMPLVALATAVATLVMTTSAQAVTLVLPDGTERPQPYQGWADELKLPTTPGVVTLRLDGDGCPAVACALAQPATIWHLAGARRGDFHHELGHHFDYTVMTPDARGAFMEVMGLVGRAWRERGGNSPHERFAEAYRMCARSLLSADDRSQGYDYQPTRSQHRRVCALIVRTGAGTAGALGGGSTDTSAGARRRRPRAVPLDTG